MNKNAIIGIVVLAALIALAMMMRTPETPVEPVPEVVATTTPTTPVVKKPAVKPAVKTTTSTKNPIAVPEVKPVAPTIPPSTPSGTTIITYTNSGFSPASITVNPGTSVQFVNKSDRGMRIFTDNPESRFFKELNQSKTVGKGGTFNFTFLYVGTWSYHNENFTSDHAKVIVQ